MKDKGKLFKRIFLSLSILGSIIITFFVLIMMNQVMKSTSDVIKQVRLDQVKQVQTNFDINLQQFEFAFSAYSTAPSFDELVTKPLTYADFAEFREANSQLNYLGTLGVEGTDLSLISLDQQWEIDNDSLHQLDDLQVHTYITNYVSNASRGLFWTKHNDALRFVISLPVSAQEKQALIIADIDNSAMKKLINVDSKSKIFVLNNDAELIHNTDNLDAVISKYDMKSITSEFHNNSKVENSIDHKGFGEYLVCSQSDYNGWMYCMSQAKHEIFMLALPSLITYSVFGLLLAAIVIFFAYKFALDYSTPIKTMSDLLALDDSEEGSNRNELAILSQSVSNLVNEQEVLKKTLESEKPQLEAQFVLNLYRNKIIPREIDEKMKQFGYHNYDPDNYSFASVLIQIDDMGHHRKAEKDLMLAVVQRIVQETIPREYRLRPVLLNDTTQATILMFEGQDFAENKKKLFNFSQEVIKNAKEFVKLSISVGISEQFTSLTDMRESCEMAKQALRHRINFGKEIVIFYEDIADIVSGPSVINYPQMRESSLFDAISLGDSTLAQDFCYKFIDDIVQLNLDPSGFEMIMIRFVNNLIEFQNQLGIMHQLYDANKKAYKVVLESYNIEEIKKTIDDQLIQAMVNLVRSKNEEQFHCLSEQVVEIIQERFDQDISLEIIADELHYNPNYLSRIFKRELGMSFSEYLIHYRIQVAKKLLIETNMTIKDIAEKLKYSNSQNFIRTFRKRVGVTPGVYRRENSNEG